MNRFASVWKLSWLLALVIGFVPACGTGSDSGEASGNPETGRAAQRLCTNAGLVSDVPSYQAPAGATVTWTASASCALVSPQYKFYVRDLSNNWSIAQDFSALNTHAWDTTGLANGVYAWQVWIREAGSTAVYETYSGRAFTVSNLSQCTSVSSAASPGGPSLPGTSVAINSSSTCGGASTPEYRILEKPPGGSYQELQAYSPSSSFTWDTTSAAVGTHLVQVWVRAQGSPNAYEAYTSFAYNIAGTAPCTGATLGASPASPALPGTSVTLTASSSSCGTPQYRFLFLPPGGAWTEAQAYSASSTFVWDTTSATPGTYAFQVWVRTLGSPASYESYTGLYYDLTSTAPCTAAALNASPPSPSVRGTAVTWTAGSASCTSPEYRFLAQDPAGTWSEVQAYSPSATFSWNTSAAVSGNYSFQVWVRASGSSQSYQTYAGKPYTLTYTATPTSAPKIAAGLYHTCVLRADGTVDCWGHNEQGQIGDGSVQFAQTPVAVTGLSNIAAIGAGYTSTCAILSDATAKCWGDDLQGQLGNGASGAAASSTTPVSVTGLTGAVSLTSGGAAHTCAVINDGTARCWGYNSQGQLGNGSLAINSPVPVTVTGLSGVVQLATGYYHSCALLGDGTVHCWGLNSAGQLGDGTNTKSMTPVLVSGLKDARSIAASNTYTCAVLFDQTVSCWGADGVTSSALPSAISGISTATSVAIGPSHACATLGDGSVRCWGINDYSELGDGTTTPATVPVTVSGLTGTTAVGVVAGYRHSCALFSDNSANCWGFGAQGVLGNGGLADSPTPVLVSLP
jgi:alpha-tubulin suppressor-like RCC1 family protein